MSLDYKTLEVGDVFYSGKSDTPFRVTSKTVCSGEIEINGTVFPQWTWTAEGDGEDHRFLITEGLEHYGPRIYSYPAYASLG